MTIRGRMKEQDKVDWKKIGIVAGIVTVGTIG